MCDVGRLHESCRLYLAIVPSMFHWQHCQSTECNCWVCHPGLLKQLRTVLLLHQASADHLVLTRPKDSSSSGRNVCKRAAEVVVGDVMWVRTTPGDEALTEAAVVAKATVLNNGLYAPLTLGGTILVNGVAASVHR